ncbi:MAG: adenylate kinase [Chloroflexi bacterium]|nr:adenylate kinase [Chloroflexota bacterium]
MRLVFLGLAGAGKGTQAKTLSEKLGVAFISSGDMFRHHLAQGTELGKLAKGYMDKGEMVPDEVTIRMILDRINQGDCQKGFILDGFPRTLNQAKALERALGDAPVDRVLYIKVGEEELVRRLAGRISCRTCGTPYAQQMLADDAKQCPRCGGELYQRADDQPEVVRRRLQVQWPEVQGLADFYGRQRKLVEIDGERPVEQVEEELVKAIDRVG